jgi:hypothetical protein
MPEINSCVGSVNQLAVVVEVLDVDVLEVDPLFWLASVPPVFDMPVFIGIIGVLGGVVAVAIVAGIGFATFAGALIGCA